MAVAEAARDLARPTIAQPQEVCYNTDPSSRGYAATVQRTAGAILLVALLGFVLALRFAGRRRRQGEGK